MPFWNEKRVNDLLTGLGKGVKGASPEEFGAFLITVVLLFLAVLWLQRRADSRRRQDSIQKSKERFDLQLESIALPPSGIHLLQRLADAMADDGQAAEIHLLFTDSSIYDQFAIKLIAEDEQLRRPLRLLKPILGLGHGIAGSIATSTEELAPGGLVRMLEPSGHPVEGMIRSSDAGGLIVEMPETTPWKGGQMAPISWERKGVHYTANVRIKEVADTRLKLEHSNSVASRHRRQFVRLECDLSGHVHGCDARIRSIGGGGFLARSESLKNKLLQSHPALFTQSNATQDSTRNQKEKLDDRDMADPVHFRIVLAGEGPLEGSAIPLHESSAGFHFSFHRIRPGDQDRIIRYILRSQQTTNAEKS